MAESSEDVVRRYGGGFVVHRIVASTFIWPLEVEDAVSLGYLTQIQAAFRFDPSLGVPFPLYASQHIRWAIQDGRRREARYRKREVPLTVVVTSEGEEIPYFDTVSSPEDVADFVEKQILQNKVREIVASLGLDLRTMKMPKQAGAWATVEYLVRRVLNAPVAVQCLHRGEGIPLHRLGLKKPDKQKFMYWRDVITVIATARLHFREGSSLV